MSAPLWFSQNELQTIQSELGLQNFEFHLFEGEFNRDLFELAPETKSKSHTAHLTGFISSSEKGIGLGVDIEQTARVSEEVARRICPTEEEYLAAPSPASLWCAKESAFKALRNFNQPAAISNILVSRWESVPGFEKFQIQHELKNSGLVFQKNSFTFSFFSIG